MRREHALQNEELYARLAAYKKIASVKHVKYMEKALEHELGGVFLLTGNIGVLKRYVDFYKKQKQLVFLHLEKIGGLQLDREGLEFVAKYVKPTGIISTKGTIIKQAKKHNLLTIQRLFLIDSDALENGLASLEETKPDAIEIMPGIVPEMIAKVKNRTSIPIITGGLLETPDQMQAAIANGAIAVSTGNPNLWGAELI
jgi:glycerol uptake operon antiterminator